MDDQERRLWLLALVAVLLLVLTGCVSPFDPGDGTGELTVPVEDRNGDPVAQQKVTVRNKGTERVVFEGTTGSNGQLVTTLDHGTYWVATDDKAKPVQFDGDETISFQIVATPPHSPGA